MDEIIEDEKHFNAFGFSNFEPEQLDRVKKERKDRLGDISNIYGNGAGGREDSVFRRREDSAAASSDAEALQNFQSNAR